MLRESRRMAKTNPNFQILRYHFVKKIFYSVHNYLITSNVFQNTRKIFEWTECINVPNHSLHQRLVYFQVWSFYKKYKYLYNYCFYDSITVIIDHRHLVIFFSSPSSIITVNLLTVNKEVTSKLQKRGFWFALTKQSNKARRRKTMTSNSPTISCESCYE